MKCKICKDKPIARGIKGIDCKICEKIQYISVEYTSSICHKCSEENGFCEDCGEKLDKILDKIKLGSLLDNAMVDNPNNIKINFLIPNEGIKNIDNLINSPIGASAKPYGVVLKAIQSEEYPDLINCVGLIWGNFVEILRSSYDNGNYSFEISRKE